MYRTEYKNGDVCNGPYIPPQTCADSQMNIPSAYTILNKQILTTKLSSGYTQGPDGKYTSDDPRLFTASRNQKICLSNPPSETNINISDIYDIPCLSSYGKHYKKYSDIDGGDILYYVDKASQDPYRYPNYSHEMNASKTTYRDPMGAEKQYYTHSIDCMNPLKTKGRKYDGELSWIHDTQLHRQDMMAYQSRYMHKNSWEYKNR